VYISLTYCPPLSESTLTIAQIPVDFSDFEKKGGATATLKKNILEITWPTEGTEKGKLILILENGKPLFESILISREGSSKKLQLIWILLLYLL
jgi:hypothetical protein